MPELSPVTETAPSSESQQVQDAANAARKMWEAARKSANEAPAAPATPALELPPATIENSLPAPPEPTKLPEIFVERRFSTPANAAIMSSALALHNVGYLSSAEKAVMPKLANQLGSGMLVALGTAQGFRDFENLQHANSGYQQAHYGGAMLADSGIAIGGALSFAKYGPRWLAPSIILGSLATRMAMDVFKPEH